MIVISTAGPAEERHEGILGQLIDGSEAVGDLEQRPGLTVSRNRDARVLVFNYAARTNDHHLRAAVAERWGGIVY